jgi:hypothetical protein
VHWIIRDDPRVLATVEGKEALELPELGRLPAFRVSIYWPDSFGPRDVARFWYGRSGFLKLVVHLEGEVTDADGNPIGLFIYDETEVVTEIDLAHGRPGRRIGQVEPEGVSMGGEKLSP